MRRQEIMNFQISHHIYYIYHHLETFFYTNLLCWWILHKFVRIGQQCSVELATSKNKIKWDEMQDGIKFRRTKLANAIFGQKKQHSALFSKLIRKMPLFYNSIIRKLRFIEELDYVIVELSSALCHAGKADVAFSN